MTLPYDEAVEEPTLLSSKNMSDSVFLSSPAGRLYAMQTGMKLDSKTPECRKFLVKLMDQLETVSQTNFSTVVVCCDASAGKITLHYSPFK